MKVQPKGIQRLRRCKAVGRQQWNLTHPPGVYSTSQTAATAGKHSYYWPKANSQPSPPIEVTIHQAHSGTPQSTTLRKSARDLWNKWSQNGSIRANKVASRSHHSSEDGSDILEADIRWRDKWWMVAQREREICIAKTTFFITIDVVPQWVLN